MKKSNTVLLTTVFPLSVKFLDEFLNSLKLQTDKDFDLLVVNDGVANFKDLIKEYRQINIIEIVSEKSIVQNRKTGIEAVMKLNYEFLIFGDSDDYFEMNRVALSKKLLKKYDIVVNDLTLFDKKGIYCKSYYSKRIDDLFEINLEFIKNKNILGLSNTAVRTESIGDLDFCKNLVALDWYFFSKLLFKNKTAVYTNQTQTYYRQYQDNTVGLGDNSMNSIKKAIKVKKIHYQCMTIISDFFDKLLCEINYLEVNIENVDFEKDKTNQSNLLWWEIPNYKIKTKKKI
ncbi:glycosyltransferase family A protein [uncultured Polaribacter sp.]|uniref:glycosyltransferase family A protein n=1 Tax=uncultured Polaribacter sp. TaxID=174711 RepID=UPI0026288961|nr:glycosyltransferase family A protein [uncultured Polaribacter sp.]